MDAKVTPPVPTPGAKPDLFVRRATGLVRDVGSGSSTVIGYIVGSPVQVIGAGLFFAFSLYPGGNIYLALALVFPMMLGYSYTFGLLTAAIPRSGGDYTLVGRILHPFLGVVSSIFMLLAQFLSCAFFGIAFATTGVAPGLVSVGLLGGNQTLVDWGNSVATQKGWQFAFGALAILLGAAMHVGGWRRTLRAQNIVFWFCMLGVGFSAIVALFTSNAEFARAFNDFAAPLTGGPDAYQATIAGAGEAGVDVNPAFSFDNTIPLLGVLAGFSIYTYFASFIGGELRNARSVGTANRMALAGTLNIVGIIIAVLLFFHSFGSEFLIAAFGNGLPPEITAPPYYFFLTGVTLDSAFVAAILALSYCAFWPLIVYLVFLQPTRMMFAYSFDGLLPKRVAAVSAKSHTPYVALAITTVLSLLTLLLSVFLLSDNFFQVLVYAIMIQLISMGLVGIAAIALPKRRPALYQGAVTTKSFLGIPLIVLAGAVSVISTVVLWVVYFKYPDLGLSDIPKFLACVAGVIVLVAIYYWAADRRLRARGVQLKRVFEEIPPE